MASTGIDWQLNGQEPETLTRAALALAATGPEDVRLRHLRQPAGVLRVSARGPSARVGIVGGGQLARMTHQAAIDLDIELVVLAADPGDAAVAATGTARIGDPADLGELRRLAIDSEVLTFDHERIPSEHLEALEAEGFSLRPSAGAKRAAQDKLYARELLHRNGFPVPRFAPIDSADEVAAIAADWGWPVVLKRCRGGYDGRGVEVAGDVSTAAAMLSRGGGTWLAEELVPIDRELSQVVVRSPSGETAAYPLAETIQEDGICLETRAPAQVEPRLARRCVELAIAIAEEIGATGVVAVELFLAENGDILVNELALRPHNSGHFTIEGCETSQFENHLRAVLDWPLGPTDLRSPAVVMRNVLGLEGTDPAGRVAAALRVPGAHLHLYGKAPRSGRKLGHVTALAGDLGEALARSRRCAALLVAEPSR